jgi:hypothetical protein
MALFEPEASGSKLPEIEGGDPSPKAPQEFHRDIIVRLADLA